MTSVRNSKRLILPFSAWLAVFIWMATIFTLSAQHSTESAALSGQFLAMLNKIFGVELSGFLLRKTAHAAEYFLLAVLVFNAILITRRRAMPFLTFLLTLPVAVSDEIHQHFVPGRACQLRDIVIDSSGAIAGILLCMTVVFVYKQLRKQKTI